MKEAKICIPILGIAVVLVFAWRWFTLDINTEFASEILLEYHYADKNISTQIIDENDVLALKQILTGRSFADSPSCGFSTDISIIMNNGNESIVFCPANDGCPLLRIGDSNKYIKITDENLTSLHKVLAKYGMVFPCV
jgi:hypothetical protein